MSTVCTTAHHRGMVHLHMLDLQVLNAQTLRLSVCLQVVEEHQEELAGSLRPSALITRGLHHMTLSVATNTAVVASERYSRLVSNDVVQIALSLDQRHTLDRSAHLMCILEVHRQVRAAGSAAYSITFLLGNLLFFVSTGVLL